MGLTVERLREVLDYEPEMGAFRWRLRTSNRVQAGDVAGSLNSDGRWQIRIDGVGYLAHRLAWLYVHGEWPQADLDHRNQDPIDNRISNLREATKAQNEQNRSRPYRRNASGLLGVMRDRGRWAAAIQVGGKRRHLGCFATPEEAHAAYLAAKREIHPFWEETPSEPIIAFKRAEQETSP